VIQSPKISIINKRVNILRGYLSRGIEKRSGTVLLFKRLQIKLSWDFFFPGVTKLQIVFVSVLISGCNTAKSPTCRTIS
jgi:hypothetical protein